MENNVVDVKWSEEALADLSSIGAFYASNPSRSIRIVTGIIKTAESIVFADQYQIDPYFPRYRRMIVGDCKIFYKSENGIVTIMSILDTRKGKQ